MCPHLISLPSHPLCFALRGIRKPLSATNRTERRTMTKPTNTVTFSPEALKAVLDEAVAEALAKHDAKPKRTVPAHGNSKAPQDAAQMDQMAIKAFRRAGFTDAQPRLNILTYRR